MAQISKALEADIGRANGNRMIGQRLYTVTCFECVCHFQCQPDKVVSSFDYSTLLTRALLTFHCDKCPAIIEKRLTFDETYKDVGEWK